MVLMLYSSAFFTAWLLIASILLHLELSMQERLRVSFLFWGTLVATSKRKHGYTKTLGSRGIPRYTPCHSEGLRTAQGRWEPPKAPLKIPTAQCFPWCLPAGVAHSLDSFQDMTNSLNSAFSNFSTSNKTFHDSVGTNQFLSCINGQLPLQDFPAKLKSHILWKIRAN